MTSPHEESRNLPQASGGTPEEVAAAGKPAPRGMFGVHGTGDTSGFGGLTVPVPAEISSPRPYGEWFDQAVDSLEAAVPGLTDLLERVVVDRGELTLHASTAGLLEIATALRNDPALKFELLSCVSGVDYLGTERRLHVVCRFTSMTYRRRLRV